MDEETVSDVVTKINIPTKNIRLDVIQEVLLRARSKPTEFKEGSEWTLLLKILWDHLQTGLKTLDEQFLCSVCFFTVLQFSQEKELFMNKVLTLVKSELVLKEKLKLNNDKKLIKEANTLQVVSLMYGMLQSKFIVQVCDSEVPIVVDVLSSSLDLLILMAYEYSRFTFMVFKILSSFKIVCGTDLENILFPDDKVNITKLLDLATDNWENPITGVRDLNKSLFQLVLSICSKDFYNDLLSKLRELSYWNKAKYLMMAVMIDQQCNFAAPDHWIKVQSHWIDGLVCSLYKPGIVSAGADMYYAVLKKLANEEEWCNLFLKRITDILQGSSTKAIEHFCNYWSLTTFKKFPGLSKILVDDLENLEAANENLYSSLCILKQANKLGLVSKPWKEDSYGLVERKVLCGIEHPDPKIRMLAFEIVAIAVGKHMPTNIEYKLILDYLQNNVNSDCTVLRISMLGNIKSFLTHLCSSYMEHSKHNQDCQAANIQEFYTNLQEFAIDSLNLNGNYQRKITTIKLCHTLLSSLNEAPKKRQKQTIVSGTAMVKFLKENDCLILFNDNFLNKLFDMLKDPADDVRDAIVQLLLEHYSAKITAPLINNLIEDAKNCIKSKFFYQISCGQSIFKLIASLLLKEKYQNTTFESIDDVFDFAYDVLNSEYALKRDVMKSIEDGKQLHAYLGVLQEVLKVSMQFGCKITKLDDEIPQLLKILEVISDQFAWEDEPTVSSDFSKMSDRIQSIIASSGYNPLDEKDVAKISGLQQIVLNCLWLNVKASCDFASCLITFLAAQSDAEACEKCLEIITHVLETSRHKGAIEAAGAALGRGVQQTTARGGAGAARRVLRRRLRARGAATSVTRRGAGLSVMLHRIVASDAQKGKPLFQYFMETLLQTCITADDAVTLDDGQRDVPKAVYIHFLTRVVMDSSLASDMMFYSADLAEIAFGNLTSPNWQIRNAALQLYGALVPKLIGQKKASGTDNESVGTVGVDEFRTHSPRLWQHMNRCLQELDHINTVESHSNVLPILNVLANLAKRYEFGNTSFSESEELLESLQVLLGSPIHTVRRLTAKSIFNIYGYDVLENITNKIMKMELVSENFLHGYLILVQHYHKHSVSKEIELTVTRLRRIMSKNRSYVNRTEFEYFSNDTHNIEDVLSEANTNRYSPGVHHWANNRLEKYVQSCSWTEMPNICKILLKENDVERYLEFIRLKLKSDCTVSKQILTEIGEILIKCEKKFQSCVIWKILYFISKQVGSTNIDACTFDYLQKEVPYKIRYVMPFLATKVRQISSDYAIRLSNIIFSLCDPDKSDVNMRYIAALANNEIAKAFHNISDNIRVMAIKCAVLLLQDEDEDVRMININFYTNIKKGDVIFHPSVCLSKILDRHFLESCLDDTQMISILCDDLLNIVESYAKSDEIDEYNPFSNDSKNIYFESELVQKLIRNVMILK